MTVRFGRLVLEYQPAGMVRNEEGEPEYQYEPVEKEVWYTAETLLTHEPTELDLLKVMV